MPRRAKNNGLGAFALLAFLILLLFGNKEHKE